MRKSDITLVIESMEADLLQLRQQYDAEQKALDLAIEKLRGLQKPARVRKPRAAAERAS